MRKLKFLVEVKNFKSFRILIFRKRNRKINHEVFFHKIEITKRQVNISEF